MASRVRDRVSTGLAVLILCVAFGLWVTVGVASVWIGASKLRRVTPVDVSVRCGGAVPQPCMSERWARVGRTYPGAVVSLTYDDGRRTEVVSLVDDAFPTRGTRVLMEDWDGATVSVYEPVRGTRYRTDSWPDRWNVDDALLPLFIGYVFLFPVLWGLGATIITRCFPRLADM